MASIAWLFRVPLPVMPVVMVGVGQPVTSDGVRPEGSEAELEGVVSVSEERGDNLRMFRNKVGISFSRASGKHGK